MDENPTVHQEMVTMSVEQPRSDAPNPVGCPKSRRLLLVLFAFSLFTTALGLGIYSHLQKAAYPWMSKWKSAAPPCLSLACRGASEHFSAAMDPFSRPCDYFLFACGAGGSSANKERQRVKGMHDETDGELDKKREARMGEKINSDGQLAKFPNRKTALLRAIKEILEAPDVGDFTNAAEQKAKNFFKSCMNTESPETLGSQPFLALLKQLGGWAVSGVWNQTDFNRTLALLMSRYSTFPFFNVYVGPDPGENRTIAKQHYIQIDQPHFQFHIDWDSKTNKSKASTPYLRPFLLSCGQYLAHLGVPADQTTQHCGLYISLSTTLAVATSPLDYRLSQKLLYHRVTIRELQALAPAIDWLACLQATFQPLPISQSDVVLIHNVPYITHMSQTINQWQVQHSVRGTGPLHTYMMFSLLQTLIPALDSRFFKTMRNYFSATGDTQEEMPRWLRCVKQTERGFDTVLSHAITERHAKEEAKELIHDVYSSLKKKLTNLRWRDDKSSAFILNKIQSLNPRLSTKTNNQNHTDLNHLYEEVVMNEDFFSNYLQMLVLEQKNKARLLSHSSQTEGLSITPSISGNDIIIPVGMFVSPFFHSSYPRALNYGTLGSLIAKDLLHLLLPDIQKQANNPESESLCVWSHYLNVTEGPGWTGAFSLPPSKQQEVWVQYSALQVALDAYKMSFTRHPEDSSLSGLSYIHLFLSSFTKVTCDADSYREFMPFEPSFLVTVLCSNSSYCPKPLTCVNKSKSYPGQLCQSRILL